MSYATSLAHLDASTGLFASAIPGIVYAIFGTCRQLNVGPEAALSLLIGQTISALVPLDPHSPEGQIAAEAVATIVGFQVCCRCRYSDYSIPQ
jgi:MFS superfamily sulfate permease-like transporter